MSIDENIARAAAVRPSPRQLAWQELEFYAFFHFGPNTFTGREWGDGQEDPGVFRPTQLDCVQWVRAAKAAGMRGVILTCKHHDGFCLWPSRYTEHSVKNSLWKDGKGDVVRELAEACAREGMKMGVYLSPWDRHEPTYGDSLRYNQYFKNQLTELLTGYGELFCVWFDGACGEGPNGKRQVYDWDGYYEVIRTLQPNAVISISGPDVRWCGNEAGICRESEWSVVPEVLLDNNRTAEHSQQADDGQFSNQLTWWEPDLGSRERIRKARDLIWYPAEVDTSIRPGWFYHAAEDGAVRSVQNLVDLYFNAVGGNASLLLNIPPDPRGLIHEKDEAALRGLGEFLRAAFAQNLASSAQVSSDVASLPGYPPESIVDGDPSTCWRPPDGVESANLTLDLDSPRGFNTILLQEHLPEGQHIERFALDAWAEGGWQELTRATVVGHKRLLRIPHATAQRLRIRILESRGYPTLRNFGLFAAPPADL